jgi:hypothetical protein
MSVRLCNHAKGHRLESIGVTFNGTSRFTLSVYSSENKLRLLFMFLEGCLRLVYKVNDVAKTDHEGITDLFVIDRGSER